MEKETVEKTKMVAAIAKVLNPAIGEILDLTGKDREFNININNDKDAVTVAIELSDAPEPKDLAIIPEGLSMDDVEKQMISRALTKADGDYEKAAAYLGISVKTLRKKLFRLNNQ